MTETIASLGGAEGEAVVDFLVDPDASLAALEALRPHKGLVARVAAPLGDGTETHGPRPAAHLWVRVMRDAREVGLASSSTGMVRRVDRVELELAEESCCDAPGCDRRRVHASVWIALEPIKTDDGPGRVLVAEERWLEGGPDDMPHMVHRIAKALGRTFGVPLSPAQADDIDDDTSAGAVAKLLPATELARFALRSEAERVVLRDWDGRGPRATAARNATIGAGLLLGALGVWAGFARAMMTSQGTGETAALGTVAALLSLAGYAFLGVARFSARYAAACTALVAIGRDKLIVLPWVGRDGAVDRRPEGRLGAAIPLADVRSANVRARDGRFAVELDTDHGAMDALVCETERAADHYAAALNRTLDAARHPKANASAKQRARERAAAE